MEIYKNVVVKAFVTWKALTFHEHRAVVFKYRLTMVPDNCKHEMYLNGNKEISQKYQTLCF